MQFDTMPHVILSGAAKLREAFDQFSPFRADTNGWIIKIKNIFISRDDSTLMVDCTAVRSGFSQDFYIRLEAKDNRVTVRVDPYMRIERNEGVQRTIAALAAWVQTFSGGMTFEKSNIVSEILADGGLQGVTAAGAGQ